MMKDYFHIGEFACKDGTSYPARYVDAGTWDKLRSTLNVIREACGVPLMVVSGYRSPAYNMRIGGAKESQHVLGSAADIKPVGDKLTAPELHTMILALNSAGKLPRLGGLGGYSTFVHVDVRPRKADGSIARWKGKTND